MGPVVVFGVVYGAAYALLGLGIVLVYKGSRVFNFAQAEFGTVAAFTVYLTHTNGVPYVFAAVLGALLGGVAGVLAPAIQPGAFTPGYMTNNFLIFAFVAAVIGGMTSLPGA